MNFSPQQQQAIDLIMKWYRTTTDKRFVLAGYAGAGKTTLAKRIAQEIRDTIFCAYTGKAANVLREKGAEPAGTIHGFLYHPKKRRPRGDADDNQPAFAYEPKSEWLEAGLVIVDEYSMLPTDLIKDIERDGRRILYLGDPFQLPPVSGECPLEPDFFIEEIHRQALDSAIIRCSVDVREGRRIEFGDHGDLLYVRQKDAAPDLFTRADQVIVGRNSTRAAFNKRFREINKFLSPLPVVGDKVICLKNNREIGLFNGMIGVARNNCRQDGLLYTLDFDDMPDLKVWKGDVLGEGANYSHNDKKLKGLERFDYAYAITAHKSQGSEFDNVLVYNQPIGQGIERRRWLYTALTRAKKRCNLVEPAA